MQAQARTMMRVLAGALALGLTAGQGAAEVAPEKAVLGDYAVTIYPHAFLSADDLAILRAIASDAQYLALFVPQEKGFSALAISPDEGFVKDGAPVASAVALGGLPDAATAASTAVEACQKAATAKTPCAVVLEVAPK